VAALGHGAVSPTKTAVPFDVKVAVPAPSNRCPHTAELGSDQLAAAGTACVAQVTPSSSLADTIAAPEPPESAEVLNTTEVDSRSRCERLVGSETSWVTWDQFAARRSVIPEVLEGPEEGSEDGDDRSETMGEAIAGGAGPA
jgi:hypothetical protein